MHLSCVADIPVRDILLMRCESGLCRGVCFWIAVRFSNSLNFRKFESLWMINPGCRVDGGVISIETYKVASFFFPATWLRVLSCSITTITLSSFSWQTVYQKKRFSCLRKQCLWFSVLMVVVWIIVVK